MHAWWRSTPTGATQPTAGRHVDTPLLRDETPVTQPVEAPATRDARRTATQNASVRDAELATHTATCANANRDATPEEPATRPDALRDADTEELSVTSADSRDAAAKHGDEAPTSRRLAAVPTPRPAAAHAAASPSTRTATDRDADDAEYLLRAQQLVDAGRTKAPVEVVVRVLRGKANGMSNRDLADETGLSESAVQRIVTAAR